MRRPLLVCLLALAFLAVSCEEDPYATGYSNPPTVGAKAPDFTQNDTAGIPVSLTQYSGRVVLLDFWATWCPPCMSDLANIKALWSTYKSQGLAIISISLDYDFNTWHAVIRNNGLNWTQVTDGKYWNNAVAKQYGVTAIPQKYLIGKDGKIIATGVTIDEETIASALR
jgi:peroxiredoxin